MSRSFSRRDFLATGLLAALAPRGSGAESQELAPVLESIRRRGQLPGLAAASIANGVIVESAAVGFRKFGADRPVTITVEIDFHGHGRFGAIASLTVEPGQIQTHVFPPGFSAHWVRVVSDTDGVASAQFVYT